MGEHNRRLTGEEAREAICLLRMQYADLIEITPMKLFRNRFDSVGCCATRRKTDTTFAAVFAGSASRNASTGHSPSTVL